MNVGIVGCGLVGQKRARLLGAQRLVACFDVDRARADALAAEHSGARAADDVQCVLEDPSIDIVIVSTPHHLLAQTALAAVAAGKHVLLEKPGGRSAHELEEVAACASQTGVLVKVGFNHRFHPALRRARQIVESGAAGELMYMRGRYGHGGRLGYEREWRADPRLSGGGELLDQGSHLIDLARWFAGDASRVSGHVANYFWPMQVEDNAFVCLETASGVISWLHASWTEWKNLFCFEIFGRNMKLQIDGLGGSYGAERLTVYTMLPEMGPPLIDCFEFPGEDQSWRDEFEHFVGCIETGETPSGSIHDAIANLKIVEELYRLNHRDYHS
jgi:predicted dehydrogenase